MTSLFKNVREFKFKEAKQKVYDKIDLSYKKEFLLYIEEAESTYDESRKIFDHVFNETKKYAINDKPPKF